MELHIRNRRAETSEGFWCGKYSAKIQPLLHSSLDGLWSINEPVCCCLVVGTVVHLQTSPWPWWIVCISTVQKDDNVEYKQSARHQKHVPVWIVSWPPSNLLGVWCEWSTGESECNKHQPWWSSGVKSIFTLKWIIIHSYCLCICKMSWNNWEPCDQMYNFNSATVMYLCQIALQTN